MENKKPYIIISGHTSNDRLEREVNEKIEEDYKPFGNIVIIEDGSMYQTMMYEDTERLMTDFMKEMKKCKK